MSLASTWTHGDWRIQIENASFFLGTATFLVLLLVSHSSYSDHTFVFFGNIFPEHPHFISRSSDSNSFPRNPNWTPKDDPNLQYPSEAPGSRPGFWGEKPRQIQRVDRWIRINRISPSGAISCYFSCCAELTKFLFNVPATVCTLFVQGTFLELVCRPPAACAEICHSPRVWYASFCKSSPLRNSH